MKLCYLANARLPSEKAHGLQIAENCDALAAAGADVTLVLPRRVNTPEYADVDPWSYYGLARSFAIRRAPCLDLFPLGRWAERIAAPIQAFTYALAVLALRRHFPADIYYSRDALLLLSASVFAPRQALAYEVHQWPRSRLGAWLQRLCLRRAGTVIAVTEGLAENLRRRGGREVVVVRDGFRAERFSCLPDRSAARRERDLPLDAFVVGYVGRFETMGMGKGVDWLVDAIVAIGDPSIHLCLVGGPRDQASAIESQWARSGLAPGRRHSVGEIPPGQVAAYLAAFDVCTLPLPATPHFSIAASPLKLFEYMAAGATIVASSLPSLAEVLRDGETALLVPPGDVAGLARAITRLRDDRAFGAKLGAAVRREAAAFSWQARAARVLRELQR